MEAHARDFQAEVDDPETAEALKRDFRDAGLGPRARALCAYAEKLTRDPRAVTPADLDRLREHGLADEDLLDLVQVVGYFNYINRVAEALGVPPEPDWDDGGT